MKKIIALILTLVIISNVVILASCNDNSTNVGPFENNDPNRADVVDDIPADLRFDGETVTVLIPALANNGWSISTYSSFAENFTGEKLNDAIYNREQRVEERFKIKIVSIMAGSAEEDDDVSARLSLSVKSGFDDYQLVEIGAVGDGADTMIKDNIFFNLMNEERFPYLNLNQPWHFDKFIEEASYNDALYYITGDLSLSLIGNMYATYFNKTIADNSGISDKDLYQLVRDKKWTIDKQLELVSRTYTDVTGNGKTEDDIYGMTMGNLVSINPYLSSFDMNIVSLNHEGTLEYNINFDRHTDILEKLYGMLFETSSILVYDDYESNLDDAFGRVVDKFAVEESLFTSLPLNFLSTKEIREMKSDYGILPIPMFDETQGEYYTNSFYGFSVWGIPTTTQNTALVSAVLEALSSYSYQYVSPTYYNDLLNGQYTRDLDSTEMIDIITTSFKMDFGEVYNYALDKVAQRVLRYILGDEKSTNITRHWRSNHKRYEKKLEEFVDAWDDLKELGN